MNETIKTLLNHKSIRSWKEDPIDEEIMQTLFEVANRTSTSNGMQNASIIRVKDQGIKDEITNLAKQKYLATAPEFLVFIADNHRNTQIIQEKEGEKNYANDSDRFFQAWTDACLMAQSIAVAAESLGLGIVYFGSILNNQEKLIEILDLPENTFPVVGMGIGYPNQEPQLKPRIKTEQKVFIDKYQTKESYLEELAEYDKEMQTYYDLRDANKRVDSFTNQVVTKNSGETEKRSEIFSNIKKQGFNI